MDDECDSIKQLVLTDLKPSVIALGDELNLSVLLKDDNSDDEVAEEDPVPACEIEEQEIITKPNELACSVCGKEFPSKKFLNRHFSRHTNRFQCQICGKVLGRKGALLRHIPRCKLNPKATYCPPKIIKVVQKDVNRYSCETCSKSFTRRENFEQHLMTHNGMQVVCSICDKVLRSLKSYRRHMKIHDDEKPSFQCAFCSAAFSLKSNLKRHELHQHFMLMTCEKCHLKVKDENILQKHRDSTITCAICSESFCLKSQLKTHQKSMHNNVWLCCKKCSGQTPFLTKCEYHLKAHVSKLHDIILEPGDCYKDKWFVFTDD